MNKKSISKFIQNIFYIYRFKGQTFITTMKKSARERSASSKMISQGDYEGSQNPNIDRKSVDPDRLSINPSQAENYKALNETSNSNKLE